MQIAVVGVNFRQAAVEVREQFILRSIELFKKRFSSFSHVFLATCNRAEIYFSSRHLPIIQEMILQELDHVYIFNDEACFAHLAKVTSGLDSAILGESEIQRQVKEAYKLAIRQQKLPSELHFLFQKALKLGKMVRSSCLYRQASGLKEVISHLLKKHVDPNTAILFIGYSQINRRIINHLQHLGWNSLTLCTRSPSVVNIKNIKVIDHQSIDSWINYPVVIVGVKESSYLLKKIDQKVSTKCLIDLCVPRGVDPSIAFLVEGGFWNIDDLMDFQKKEFKPTFDAAPLESEIAQKAIFYHLDYRKKMEKKGRYLKIEEPIKEICSIGSKR
ncbi:MAG: hypothetical protein FJZ56_00525 [Chlamydiae bacterium]|nr:hypothetical protein [Chlamydiota bacterium]